MMTEHIPVLNRLLTHSMKLLIISTIPYCFNIVKMYMATLYFIFKCILQVLSFITNVDNKSGLVNYLSD